MLKRLLIALLFAPVLAFGQTLPKDTMINNPSTAVTPQWRSFMWNGKLQLQAGVNGKYLFVPTYQFLTFADNIWNGFNRFTNGIQFGEGSNFGSLSYGGLSINNGNYAFSVSPGSSLYLNNYVDNVSMGLILNPGGNNYINSSRPVEFTQPVIHQGTATLPDEFVTLKELSSHGSVAGSGLTKTDSIISLGGTLTQPTVIDATGQSLTFIDNTGGSPKSLFQQNNQAVNIAAVDPDGNIYANGVNNNNKEAALTRTLQTPTLKQAGIGVNSTGNFVRDDFFGVGLQGTGYFANKTANSFAQMSDVTNRPDSTTISNNYQSKIWKNVKVDGGAKGDSVTVDNAAIQSVLNGGGNIYFPAGTYLIDVITSLQVPSNTNLFFDKKAKLVAKGNSSAYTTALLKIDLVSNVTVTGGTFVGDRYSHSGTTGEHGFGIRIYGSVNTSVTDANISACFGDGLYVGADTTTMTLPAKNITINRVTCSDNRRNGASFTYVDGFTVLNSTFQTANGTAPQAGLDLEPNTNQYVKNGVVRDCKFIGNTFTGFLTAVNGTGYIDNVQVINNTMSGNGSYGARLISVTNGSLSENAVFDNGTLANNTYSNISIEGTAANNQIKNNIVKLGATYANKSRYGLQILSTTKNNDISGNDILGSGITGNLNDASTQNKIYNNKLDSLQNSFALGHKPALPTASNQISIGNTTTTDAVLYGLLGLRTYQTTTAATDSVLQVKSGKVGRIAANTLGWLASAQTWTNTNTFTTTNHNLINLANQPTAFNTTATNSLIYGTAATGTGIFTGAGNLVLQSRPIAGRSINFVTGSTPTIRAYADDNGFTVNNSLRLTAATAGTAGTDSILVKNATTNVVGKIAANYYAPLTATRLKPNATVGYIGDSHFAYGIDTGNPYFDTWGETTWFNFYTGGRFYQPSGYNKGVAGNTTTQMVARLGAALADRPDLVLVEGGGNDISAGATAATIQTNLQTIVNAYQAAGSKVIIRTIYPRFSPNAFTGPQETIRTTVNAFILTLASANVQVVDATGVVTTSASYQSDGIHLTSQGANTVGALWAAKANTLIDQSSLADYYNADNSFTTNLALTGTGGSVGGGATGTVANNWTLAAGNAGGATAAGSKTTTNNLNQQVITLGGTKTGTNRNVALYNTTATTAIQQGDVTESVFDFEVTTALQNVSSFSVNTTYDGASGYLADSYGMYAIDGLAQNLPVGRYQLRGFPFVAPAGVTQVETNVIIQLADGTSLPVSGVIKIWKAGVRKVLPTNIQKPVLAGSGISVKETTAGYTVSASSNIVEITGTSQTAAANTIYIPHNSSLTTITVPATTTIGSLYQVIGEGTGGWKLQLPAGYTAVGVGSFTTTSGGSLNSTDKNCTITIRLTNTNKFTVTTSQGTINPL